MLTKDLVRFNLKGTAVQPGFIDPEKPELLAVAENLLEIYRNAVGKTRSQLEEESKLIVDASSTSALFARGLEKLLMDRVEFETAADDDLIQWRHQLFLQSSTLLSEEIYDSVDDYHRALSEKQGKSD